MRPTRLLLALCLCLPLAAPPAHAQLIGRIGDRIQRDAERRIEQRAVEAARRTLDLAEDAIVCAVTDEECIAEARRSGQEPVVVRENGEVVSGHPSGGGATPPDSGGDTASGPSAPSADSVWANYEFIPGERILFAHDFEGTRVGNFPSRIDYIAGNLDVVRLGSGDAANQVLRVGEEAGAGGGNGCFSIPLPEVLPERFTLEFRVRTTDPLQRVNLSVFSDGSDDTPDTRCNYPPNPHLYVQRYEQGLQLPGGHGAPKAGENKGLTANTWMSVALGCDGLYCKMYVDGERVANVPAYDFPRANKLHVFLNVYREQLFLDDIRIAEGGARSLYDDLQAEGFISTTAIRFDSGSAVLRPESGGILNEILAMLEEHADLALIIEGHTDSDGSDAFNQTLSESRAQAVVAWLTARGVAGGRLDAVGHGESQPVADNATAEGKAQNRRVVLRARG